MSRMFAYKGWIDPYNNSNGAYLTRLVRGLARLPRAFCCERLLLFLVLLTLILLVLLASLLRGCALLKVAAAVKPFQEGVHTRCHANSFLICHDEVIFETRDVKELVDVAADAIL